MHIHHPQFSPTADTRSAAHLHSSNPAAAALVAPVRQPDGRHWPDRSSPPGTGVPLRCLRFATLLLALALAASARGGQSVSLSWNPSASSDVVGYAVYRGTNSGVYISRFDVGTNLDITLTGLKEGLTNYFTVTAYNAAGLEGTAAPAITYIVPGVVVVTSTGLGSPAALSFPVAAGHTYTVQASTNLSAWTNLWVSPVESANAWIRFVDPQSGSYSHRFYRLILN